MAERRPRFESRRGKPYKEEFSPMRQSEYVGAFQSINTGLRRISQVDGWSRAYENGSQSIPIERPYMDKIYRDR